MVKNAFVSVVSNILVWAYCLLSSHWALLGKHCLHLHYILSFHFLGVFGIDTRKIKCFLLRHITKTAEVLYKDFSREFSRDFSPLLYFQSKSRNYKKAHEKSSLVGFLWQHWELIKPEVFRREFVAFEDFLSYLNSACFFLIPKYRQEIIFHQEFHVRIEKDVWFLLFSSILQDCKITSKLRK